MRDDRVSTPAYSTQYRNRNSGTKKWLYNVIRALMEDSHMVNTSTAMFPIFPSSLK
jgi:hypothetical protein